MEIPGTEVTSLYQGRVALGVDTASIVRKLASVKDARALPPGAIVGDLHGGLTFTDAVAAALEARSTGGWQELQTPSGETWTLIIVNR
jgi:crotonobetainyl-CoA:carnitine CoA-transferase CaiB-like acyl-CoA transferase